MSAITTDAVPAPKVLDRRSGRSQLGETAFQWLTLLALLIAVGILVILIADILSGAVPHIRSRGIGFFTDSLSSRPARTGLLPALMGSLQIAIITTIVAFPLGIATATYLEEYANGSWFTRTVDIAIRNLAGVPSIVYGLLGFAVFVKFFGFAGPFNAMGGNGRTALAGGLTLAVLALPIVVITAAEAIRAVPQTLREAGFGLGATRWEVTRKLVLPNAAPGILTGMILSLSRAIGETAPLLVIGAATFVGLSSTNPFATLREPFTALPVIAFNYAKRPQREFVDSVAPATALTLLLFTLSLNAIAIVLRNRYEKRALK